jgi:hypothetical protein
LSGPFGLRAGPSVLFLVLNSLKNYLNGYKTAVYIQLNIIWMKVEANIVYMETNQS